MAKKTKDEPKYEQDAAEVAKMLGFYSGQFDEVHSVTCMNCSRVVAVEVAPIRTDGIVLEKGRTLYTYQDLLLSVRRREDATGDNTPMYGYQCICGNSTILAEVEKGEVAERTVVAGPDGIVADTGPLAPTSPYERQQTQANVRLRQATSKKKADYEKTDKVERYETFKLERVK